MGNGTRGCTGRRGIGAAGLALIAALAATVVGGCGCRGVGTGAGTGGAASTVGQEGATLPEFALTALDGRRLDREALRGKIVIVDFWDTWCGPCLRALPHLKAIGAEHPDVVVVAVALGQEGEGKVREVVARQELSFPVCLLSAQGDLKTAFGEIEALPTTFLIGKDGVIRRRWVGAQSPTTYDNAVRALLES